MYPSYIPAQDAAFRDWLLNFSTLITANPTNYGLIAGDAVIIAAQYTAFSAAYLTATNPTTRTSANIAAKDAARANAEAVVRPYAQRVRNNTTVSNALKIGLGITVPSVTPTPIPAPVVAPELGLQSAIPLQQTLTFRDPTALGKAKPFGVIGVEIFRAIGTVPAVDPLAASYVATVTKTPFRQTFVAGNVGNVCTYFARFVTRSGPGGASQVGPFSAPLAVSVI